MKPLHDYIAIELVDEPSSIIYDKPASPKGKVTAVSDKVKDIAVGDIVYYYAKTGHEYKGQHFIKADQVLGKV